jgi:perosamine synthetase
MSQKLRLQVDSQTNTELHMIPISRPSLSEDEAAAARQTILSGWITQGPQVAALEQEFSQYVGSQYACAVSNCTTALHLALLAVGVGNGDEVVTVSHSFVATANAIRYCGAKPVFVDIDRNSFNLDPRLLEAAITPRTKAILPVHQIGNPVDLDAILMIANRFDLPVVEDAACAIGSQVFRDGHWQRIGQPHGQIACFSFHPRKVITTGEGGMLTTNSCAIDRKLRLLRQHGMSLSDTQRHESKQVVFEEYVELGFNYRMSDLQASVGRVQLRRLPELLERRRELAERYTAELSQLPGIQIPASRSDVRCNYQSYAIRVSDSFRLSRDQLMQQLLDSGICTRRGIMNVHQEPAYGELGDQFLPESESARDQIMLLPMYDSLTFEEQQLVIQALWAAGGTEGISPASASGCKCVLAESLAGDSTIAKVTT